MRKLWQMARTGAWICFLRISTKSARLAAKLAEGLISRDGVAARRHFVHRLEEAAVNIFPAAKVALAKGDYTGLAHAFNTLCTQTLDNAIVDENFPIVRTASYFKNSYPPVSMLLAMANFFALGEEEAFLCGLAGAAQNDHHIRVAYSHILSRNGKYRQAADEALAAQRLFPYDSCAGRRVNDTQWDLLSHGLPADFIMPKADKSQFFCPLPFTLHQFVRGAEIFSLVAAGVCECSDWTSLAFEQDASWNSEDMQIFRESILDGSFKYCDERRCRFLKNDDLPLRSQITDPWLRSVIDTNSVYLDRGPETLSLGYDMVCNLRCPSCRSEWLRPDTAEVEALNLFVDTALVPLLANAKQLQMSNSGEALASPHSRRILQSLTPEKYPGLKVILLSNLSLFSPQTWEQLGDSAACIKKIFFSVDGSTPSTLERLRLGLKWERMLDALDFARTLRKSGALESIVISVVWQKDNYKELPGILDMASEFFADELYVISIVGHGGYSKEEFLDINIADPLNPLHEEGKAVLEDVKAKHARMLHAKDAVLASGRSIPQIIWRVS